MPSSTPYPPQGLAASPASWISTQQVACLQEEGLHWPSSVLSNYRHLNERYNYMVTFNSVEKILGHSNSQKFSFIHYETAILLAIFPTPLFIPYLVLSFQREGVM